jgi:tetratricopeptide (TPR) repeat protein
MKITSALLSLLLCVSIAQAAPKKSSAQKSKEEARARAAELFSQSKAYYNVHEYQRALEGFKEAYILSQESVLLLNMGQCYRYMGQYQSAISSFQTFLQEDPATPYAENVNSLLAEMRQKLDEMQAPAPVASLPVEPAPQPQPSKSLPPAMLSDEPYRVPTFLYGATAGAFVLGAGAGGLAVVLSRQEEEIVADPQNPSFDALLEENQQKQKSARGAMIGLGVVSVITATTGVLLFRHHKKQKKETLEPIEAIFEAPGAVSSL